MFLCLGSIPELPHISITPLVPMLVVSSKVFVQEAVKILVLKLKEWMLMCDFLLVVLLGTAGSFG